MKTTIKTIGLAAVTTLALVGCGGGSGGEGGYQQPQAQPFPAPTIGEALKNEYLSAVNRIRKKGAFCGNFGYFPPTGNLKWNEGLYKSAYEHSQDMEKTGYFEHEGSGTSSDWTAKVLGIDGRGSTPGERIENSSGGNIDVDSSSENIAFGHTSIKGVFVAWMGSDAHCQGIMNAKARYFGMARVGNYWTQNFDK